MSIIHEAMKKTGQPSSAGSPEPEKPKTHPILEKQASSPRRPPIVEVHRRRSSANWGALVVLAVFFIAAGPFLAPYFLKGTDRTQATARPEGPARQFAIEEAPVPHTRPAMPSFPGFTRKEPFTLSGVVYSQKESYCLINGLVLRVGERIGEATVERITPDEVTLDMGGRKLTLPVAKP